MYSQHFNSQAKSKHYHCARLFILIGTLGITSFSWAKSNLLNSEQQIYPIENEQLIESSGLACSTRDDNLLWSHNDSGHMPIIYALDGRGKNKRSFYLEGVQSNDWEDMDAFEYAGEHYLLIADTGDNLHFRWDYQIIIIKEPALTGKSRGSVSPAWSFVFKFENNRSYDVEAVAVDVQRKKIMLLSKHSKPSYLFELPLIPPAGKQVLVAKKIAEFKDMIKPTALDISADGRLMSINTYRRVHRWEKKSATDNWRYKHSIKYKKMFQPEAMCLSNDEKNYYISSERKSYLLKLKAR